MSLVETEAALKALGNLTNVDRKDVQSFIMKHVCTKTDHNFNLHEKKILYLNKRIVENKDALQVKCKYLGEEKTLKEKQNPDENRFY